MRWLRAAYVLGLAACGYAPLPIPDAPLDVVADLPHVALTWQLATSSSNGKPSAMLEYPPFAPATAPAIRTATIDGPFVAADYSSDPATPGWILVPRSYFVPPGGASGPPAPWRLEYTLPGDLPHEVQWAPDDKIGHLVVPVAGRLDRQAVPTGSGYDITLNTSVTFSAMEKMNVLTTGLWTASQTPSPASTMIKYDFSSSGSLSGSRGAPDDAHGDRAFVVDYTVNPDMNGVMCYVAIGSTALTSVALTPGAHTTETVPWDTLRQRVASQLPRDTNVIARLTSGLDKLNTVVSNQDSLLVFGSVPSVSFPGLIGSSLGMIPNSPVPRLPVPVMQMLLQCPVGPASPGPATSDQIPNTAQPTMLADFPTAVHVQMVEARPVPALGIPALYSGIETVIAADAGGAFQLSFPAAMPTKMRLTTPAGDQLDLVDNTDQIAVGAPTGAFILDFVPEVGAGVRADYYDVVLHQIKAGGMLTTERIYTVTAPRVRIDGAVLKPASDYVFEIRSYKGHLMAPRGDFAPIDYPYGSAVVFTRTFRTS